MVIIIPIHCHHKILIFVWNMTSHLLDASRPCSNGRALTIARKVVGLTPPKISYSNKYPFRSDAEPLQSFLNLLMQTVEMNHANGRALNPLPDSE